VTSQPPTTAPSGVSARFLPIAFSVAGVL